MKHVFKIFKFLVTHFMFIRNCVILLGFSRLLYLEENQLALIAEIIGGIVLMFKDYHSLQDNS